MSCFIVASPLLQVPISALMSFVDSLEMGYSKYKNPYHNLMHAADVTQTIHYLLLKTGMVVSVDANFLKKGMQRELFNTQNKKSFPPSLEKVYHL